MAALANGNTTELKLMVENGIGKSGQPLYATRSISGISPALTDDDAYDIGKDLASLQSHTLGSVKRINAYTLIEA